MDVGTEPSRVLIADDQAITRAGLRGLLESVAGLEIVGEATNGSEVVQLAAQLQPDVVLMDLRMPGTNGIEATRRIHRDAHLSPPYALSTSVIPPGHRGVPGYLSAICYLANGSG